MKGQPKKGNKKQKELVLTILLASKIPLGPQEILRLYEQIYEATIKNIHELLSRLKKKDIIKSKNTKDPILFTAYKVYYPNLENDALKHFCRLYYRKFPEGSMGYELMTQLRNKQAQELQTVDNMLILEGKDPHAFDIIDKLRVVKNDKFNFLNKCIGKAKLIKPMIEANDEQPKTIV